MEEERHEEIKSVRHYKIEAGDKITIKRDDFDGKAYYKTPITKKNKDGTKNLFYKNIFFPKGTNLEDGACIIVKEFFEDVYARKNDRFNANWTLFIKDFEIVSNENVFEEYNKSKSEFDINEINNDDLPF